MRGRLDALADVQAGIDGLVPLVKRAIELDVELHAARRALGEQPGRLLLRSRIADVIG